VLRHSGLLGMFQAYGFRDMGVFFDWASLFQKDPELWTPALLVPEEKRTEDQRRDAELYRESRTPYTRADDQYLWAHRNEPGEQLAKALGRGPNSLGCGPKSCEARLKQLRDPSTEGHRRLFKEALSDAKVSEEERRAAIIQGEEIFNFALGTLDLWYAHAKTTVVLLTELPKKLPKSFDAIRTYDRRGWTTYERCSAELCKAFRLQQAGWPLVIDLGKKRAALRRLPTTPEQMGELLKKCSFTNGADKEMVLKKYEKTARAVLGGVNELSFFGIPFDPMDPWRSPERLGQALNFCVNLKRLDLSFTGLTDDHLASISKVLSSGALPQLEQLFLGFNRLGPRGVEALGSALIRDVARCLKDLILFGNDFGDAGLQSFAAFIAKGMAPELQFVDLAGNDFGDAGAVALADAVRLRLSGECKVGTFFPCGFNHVGMRGRLALSAAGKIKNRAPDFVQFFSSIFMNALFPRGFKEGCKRTFRHEVYSYLHAEYHRDHHARSKRDLLVAAQEVVRIQSVVKRMADRVSVPVASDTTALQSTALD
jgi:hypothetical protein